MNNYHTLEIKRDIIGGELQSDSAVIFNSRSQYSSGIIYDEATGVITFEDPGQYLVRWWVTTETTLRGPLVFAIETSRGDVIIGNSPTKTGQVSGFGVIDVAASGETMRLVNRSPNPIVFSTSTPATAYLEVTRNGDGSGGVQAFGGIYGNAAHSVFLTPNTPSVISMPNTTGYREVIYGSNTITVNAAGNYHIIYSMYPRFDAPATLTLAVRSSGVNLAQSVNAVTVPAQVYGINYFGDIIETLPAGAVIDMAVTSSDALNMSFDGESTESLKLFRLD